MFVLLTILSIIIIAGLVLFGFFKPATESSYEEINSAPVDVPETLQQRGQLECIMPNPHSH